MWVLLYSGTDGSGIVSPERGISQVRELPATPARCLRGDARRSPRRLCRGHARLPRLSAGEPARRVCLASRHAVAERWSVPISATTDLTVYLLPTVFAAVVFGPLAAPVVAAASMLGDPELFRRGDPATDASILKWVITRRQLHHWRRRGADRTGSERSISLARSSCRLSPPWQRRGIGLLFAIVTSQVRRRSMRELATFASARWQSHPFSCTRPSSFCSWSRTQESRRSRFCFRGPTLAFQRLYTLYQRERRSRR